MCGNRNEATKQVGPRLRVTYEWLPRESNNHAHLLASEGAEWTSDDEDDFDDYAMCPLYG